MVSDYGPRAAGQGWTGQPSGTSSPIRQDISLGIDFFAPAQRALTKWGDFILYKNTPGNILAQGRFDGNWKLTSADAEKLAGTGVLALSPLVR